MSPPIRIADVLPVVHADGHYSLTFTEWLWSEVDADGSRIEHERDVGLDVRVAPAAIGVDIEPWGSPGADGYYEARLIPPGSDPEERIWLSAETVRQVLHEAEPWCEAAWRDEDLRQGLDWEVA